MPDRSSETATFLFTDVEGSTRLLKELREGYGDILAEHQRILREAFAAHGGEEVDTQGDSFFAAFRRAQDAVLAAAEAQRALTAHEWPEGGELRVRMGIHTGQVEVSENRYLGVAVHRAARICAAGHGGQVLVSQTTKGLLDDEEVELPGLEFRDLGEQRLKDLDRPIGLFQLGGEGLPEDFPPLTTAASAPFAGREEELAAATAAALSRRRLPVRNLAIAAAALVLIVAPVAVLLAGRSSGAKAVTVRPNSVAVIDPKSNKVVGDVSVGRDPAQLAYLNGNMWVVNSRDVTLSRISARTLEPSPPDGVSCTGSDGHRRRLRLPLAGHRRRGNRAALRSRREPRGGYDRHAATERCKCRPFVCPRRRGRRSRDLGARRNTSRRLPNRPPE